MSLSGANTTDPTQLGPPPTGLARWAGRAHGRLISACIVTLNILLVLLFYFYFWRIFWKKPTSSDAAEPNPATSTSSQMSSASSSPRTHHHHHLRKPIPEVVAGLPVFVHSSTTSPNTTECAVCLAEFKDGDRGRVLPRCGHRFHVDCVDMWAQFHTTCPLCRASLEPDSVPDPEPEPELDSTV